MSHPTPQNSWKLIQLDPISPPAPAPEYALRQDPRAQTHIPLQKRLDARLTLKPLALPVSYTHLTLPTIYSV